MECANLKRGFTLFEVIIYVGLFSFALAIMMMAVATLLGNQNQNSGWVEVREEASFLMRKIQRELTAAKTVSAPAPGASGVTLSLTTYAPTGNPVVISFSGETVTLSRAGGTAYPLTAPSVRVHDVVFTSIPAEAGGVEAVTVAFGTTSKRKDFSTDASMNLTNTIYLRK